MDSNVTRMLRTAAESGGIPSEDLLPLVYDELRSLAASRLKGENPNQTLQATALVHEAWLRIAGKSERSWNDKAHFFRIAASEMRRILVDNARRKSSLKRGQSPQPVDIDHIDLAETRPDERILLIEEMLKRLEVADPDRARVVTLKFFGGLTEREIAEVEGIAERTVRRLWAGARVFLFEMISSETK